MDIEHLFSASEEDISSIDGFGGIMARAVVEYFSLDATRGLIDRLQKAGVNTRSKDRPTGDRLAGLSFVLTGTLPHMTRSEAGARIERLGGKVSSSVSKRLVMSLRAKKPAATGQGAGPGDSDFRRSGVTGPAGRRRLTYPGKMRCLQKWAPLTE